MRWYTPRAMRRAGIMAGAPHWQPEAHRLSSDGIRRVESLGVAGRPLDRLPVGQIGSLRSARPPIPDDWWERGPHIPAGGTSTTMEQGWTRVILPRVGRHADDGGRGRAHWLDCRDPSTAVSNRPPPAYQPAAVCRRQGWPFYRTHTTRRTASDADYHCFELDHDLSK